MPTNEITKLFKHGRLPEQELKILALILYLPIGLVLIILRLILMLVVLLIGCTLSDSSLVHKLVNKIACLALGISVKVENPEKVENVEVYISNALSIFDHIAVHAATGSITPGSQMHPALSRGLGIHNFGPQTNLESYRKKINQVILEKQIAVFFSPEEIITSGKAILKFKSFPFSIANKIQPVCINVERPVFGVSVTSLEASYWSDVFFYLLSPCTKYKLKFLPSLEKKDLPDEEFAEVVRQTIAAELELATPELSAADILEWAKRQLVEQQRSVPSPRVSPNVDSEVRRMAMQVKEVLPHVPLAAILKDLNKSRSVDNTITNVLEGRVQFVPERSSTAQPSTSGGSPSTSSPSFISTNTSDPFNTAASTFAKSAHDRNKSFQERKDQLIANARRRFIEKHSLDLTF